MTDVPGRDDLQSADRQLPTPLTVIAGQIARTWPIEKESYVLDLTGSGGPMA